MVETAQPAALLLVSYLTEWLPHVYNLFAQNMSTQLRFHISLSLVVIIIVKSKYGDRENITEI